MTHTGEKLLREGELERAKEKFRKAISISPTMCEDMPPAYAQPPPLLGTPLHFLEAHCPNLCSKCASEIGSVPKASVYARLHSRGAWLGAK